MRSYGQRGNLLSADWQNLQIRFMLAVIQQLNGLNGTTRFTKELEDELGDFAVAYGLEPKALK